MDRNIHNNHGIVDAYLLNIDSIGNIIDLKCYGGSSIDYGSSIIEFDNNVYITEYSNSTDADITSNKRSVDAFISKTNVALSNINYSKTNNILLYPNPVNDLLCFQTSIDLIETNIFIYDLIGKLIKIDFQLNQN